MGVKYVSTEFRVMRRDLRVEETMVAHHDEWQLIEGAHNDSEWVEIQRASPISSFSAQTQQNKEVLKIHRLKRSKRS